MRLASEVQLARGGWQQVPSALLQYSSSHRFEPRSLATRIRVVERAGCGHLSIQRSATP